MTSCEKVKKTRILGNILMFETILIQISGEVMMYTHIHTDWKFGSSGRTHLKLEYLHFSFVSTFDIYILSRIIMKAIDLFMGK